MKFTLAAVAFFALSVSAGEASAGEGAAKLAGASDMISNTLSTPLQFCGDGPNQHCIPAEYKNNWAIKSAMVQTANPSVDVLTGGQNTVDTPAPGGGVTITGHHVCPWGLTSDSEEDCPLDESADDMSPKGLQDTVTAVCNQEVNDSAFTCMTVIYQSISHLRKMAASDSIEVNDAAVAFYSFIDTKIDTVTIRLRTGNDSESLIRAAEQAKVRVGAIYKVIGTRYAELESGDK